MSRSKNLATIHKGCVACGSCVKSCPAKAVAVYKGLYAAVQENRCVGCGKCASACPAGIIEVRAREGLAV